MLADVRHDRDVQPIWEKYCSCHITSIKPNANSPRLDPETAYDNIVGVQAWQVAMPLVTPGNPEESYLWHKLSGTAQDVGSNLWSTMPLLGNDRSPDEGLDPDELALIEVWIESGAAR